MLIPSLVYVAEVAFASLSRRVNANSQLGLDADHEEVKLIKKGEC